DISQKQSNFDHILQTRTTSLKDFFEIFESTLGLLLKISYADHSSQPIQRGLTRNKQPIANSYCLRQGKRLKRIRLCTYLLHLHVRLLHSPLSNKSNHCPLQIKRASFVNQLQYAALLCQNADLTADAPMLWATLTSRKHYQSMAACRCWQSLDSLLQKIGVGRPQYLVCVHFFAK